MRGFRWFSTSFENRISGLLSFGEQDFLVPKDFDNVSKNAFKDGSVWLKGKLEDSKCNHCSNEVEHAAQLWICSSCGEYRCKSCKGQNKIASCPSCGVKSTLLSLPSARKTEEGVRLLQYGTKGLFIRICCFAVALDAQQAFRAANDMWKGKKDAKKMLEMYDYAVKCLNWIRLSAPEYFHTCGYDSDLIRYMVMRENARDQAETVERCIKAFPDLFCNQTIVRCPELNEHKELKGKNRGKTSSLFIKWNELETSLLEEEDKDAWKRVGKIYLDTKTRQNDVLFAQCQGILHAKEKWEKPDLAFTDHKWVFPTDLHAAHYLAFRYHHLSDGLPLLENALSIGTDCVVYGGAGALKSGKSHVAFAYVYREQNVVCKFTWSKTGVVGASNQVLQKMFHKERVESYSLGSVIQMKMQNHAVTKENKSKILSLFGL